MVKFQQRSVRRVMAKACFAAFVMAGSVGAQAALLYAGATPWTGQTNPQVPTTDGTVYYAVFDRVGGTLTDPWNASIGAGLTDLAARFLPGKDNGTGLTGPALAMGAQYLYVYETFNNGTNTNGLSQNSVAINVTPLAVSSFGAFQRLPGGGAGAEEGTGLAWPVGVYDAPFPACPTGTFANPSPQTACGAALAGEGVNIEVSPGTSGFHTFRTGLTGVRSSVEYDVSSQSLIGRFLAPDFSCSDGSTPVAGPPVSCTTGTLQNAGGSGLLLPGQHSVVFGFTSDIPPVPGLTSIIDGGQASNGRVPTNLPSVPEPMILALLGSGLLMLGWSRRAKK